MYLFQTWASSDSVLSTLYNVLYMQGGISKAEEEAE